MISTMAQAFKSAQLSVKPLSIRRKKEKHRPLQVQARTLLDPFAFEIISFIKSLDTSETDTEARRDTEIASRLIRPRKGNVKAFGNSQTRRPVESASEREASHALVSPSFWETGPSVDKKESLGDMYLPDAYEVPKFVGDEQLREWSEPANPPSGIIAPILLADEWDVESTAPTPFDSQSGWGDPVDVVGMISGIKDAKGKRYEASTGTSDAGIGEVREHSYKLG